MSCTVFKESESAMPNEHDRALASQSSRELAALLPKKEKDFKIAIKKGKQENLIVLPFVAIRLLLQILTEIAEGNAVTIIPIHAELTTQQAADLLNVSRPYLIKLLEEGQLPYHKIGSHRRILFSDLLSFKKALNVASYQALDELTNQAQKLNMGY